LAGNFVQKQLQFTIQLTSNPQTSQPGVFSATKSNSAIISNVRASVEIVHSGAIKSTANVRIYGLSQSLMNDLTTLGFLYNQIPNNAMIIEAGDAQNGLTQIFSGTINGAHGDYQSAPDVALNFELVAAGYAQWFQANALSFPGATDVWTVVQKFAEQLGLNPENDLPSAVSGPYQGHYLGTLLEQVREYAEHAHVVIEITDGGTTLAVWPKGGSRNTNSPPILSPETGMIGYPTFTTGGVVVRAIFNPKITLGSKFTIQSSIPQASKTWTVQTMGLNLESQVPDGQWMMTIGGWAPTAANPLPPPQPIS
jgi:hypothetical protein